MNDHVKPLALDQSPSFRWLKWWMRSLGVFYLFLFVAAAILKIPIQVLAPEGTLHSAAGGDELARFLVDTWVILGLALGAMGIALMIASRFPGRAIILAWTAMGFEFIWGILSDLYQLARGHSIDKILPWLIIHTLIITTGFLALRKAGSTKGKSPSQ